MENENHTLTTKTLEVRCDPRNGGRISHFIPRESGKNQFHWNPIEMDLRNLPSYVPIGGWKEMIVHKGCPFPGAHWNQIFQFERLKGEEAPSARMRCEAGGIQLTRAITLDENKAAATIKVECENVSDATIHAVRVQTQPMLTLEGRLDPKATVLIPEENSVSVLTLTIPKIQPKRVGSTEREPQSNWWGCVDPDAGATLLIEDVAGNTALHNLHHGLDLLILHNFGETTELQPGGVIGMELTVHYYSVDIIPLVSNLGATRFLPKSDLIIGVKVSETEVSKDDETISVEVGCASLADASPTNKGIVSLLNANNQSLRELNVSPRCDGNQRLAKASVDFHLEDLPFGDYSVVFSIENGERAATTTFSLKEQTQLQKRNLARQQLTEQIETLESRVKASKGDGFVNAMTRHDLVAARTLLNQDAIEQAGQYAEFALNAMDELDVDSSINFPHPKDLNIANEWLQAIENAIPEILETRHTPDFFGSLNLENFDHAWYFLDDACAAYALSLLYFHPSSQYHDDVNVLLLAVTLTDSLCRAFEHGSLPRGIARDNNTNRFVLGPLAEALRILLELPISTVRKEFWKERFRQGVEHQIEAYGGQSIPQDGYLNQDVMYLLFMRHAHLIFGESRYLRECEYILDMMESQALPDGAFHYIYPHNEVNGYHEINLTFLFRDWHLSGDERSRRLVADTVEYYPLMVSGGGWIEFSSQTWWKHTTGRRWVTFGPAVVAGVTGDGRNQYLATRSGDKSTPLRSLERLIFASLAARDDIKPEPPPERSLILDRNVKGPRGRFGPFSWVGTTAPYRDTFVGAMFSTRDDEQAHVMHYAGPRVLFGETNVANPHRNGLGLAMSPEKYQSDVAVQENRAAMCVQYDLHQYQQWLDETSESDWISRQLWYFDDERLIGLMILEAKTETTARAVDLSARFASYTSQDNCKTELRKIAGDEYASGPLRLRVIEHNLGADAIEDAWTCTYELDSPGRGLFARSNSKNGKFQPGDRFHLLVEIRTETTATAEIERVDDAVGFKIGVDGTERTVRMESGDAEVTCSLIQSKMN